MLLSEGTVKRKIETSALSGAALGGLWKMARSIRSSLPSLIKKMNRDTLPISVQEPSSSVQGKATGDDLMDTFSRANPIERNFSKVRAA